MKKGMKIVLIVLLVVFIVSIVLIGYSMGMITTIKEMMLGALFGIAIFVFIGLFSYAVGKIDNNRWWKKE